MAGTRERDTVRWDCDLLGLLATQAQSLSLGIALSSTVGLRRGLEILKVARKCSLGIALSSAVGLRLGDLAIELVAVHSWNCPEQYGGIATIARSSSATHSISFALELP